MDARLNQTADDILSQEGVKGVLMCDKNGLCIVARGEASPNASGFLYSVLLRAVEHGNEDATICVETESSNVYLRRQDDMMVAVYKAAPPRPAPAAAAVPAQ